MTTLTTISGATVAPFAFGTMQFGGTAGDSEAAEMFDTCRAAGITHFDSAWLYTGGAADRMLGRLVTGAREDLFIATKVGMRGGSGRANILEQFEESRGRLMLDTVDLLYLHRFDPDTPLEESIETLAGLQAKGRVRMLGLSNFAAWQVMKAQGVARAMDTRIDVVQPMYNLVKRQAEVEILPMCQDQDIACVPYSPLGGGLLTGKYATGGTGRITDDPKYRVRYGQDAMHRAAEGLVALARERDTHPATLAVAWVAAHPAGPQPILSGRDIGQLRPALDGMQYKMDAALYARMAALYPAPPPATDRLEEQDG